MQSFTLLPSTIFHHIRELKSLKLHRNVFPHFWGFKKWMAQCTHVFTGLFGFVSHTRLESQRGAAWRALVLFHCVKQLIMKRGEVRARLVNELWREGAIWWTCGQWRLDTRLSVFHFYMTLKNFDNAIWLINLIKQNDFNSCVGMRNRNN